MIFFKFRGSHFLVVSFVLCVHIKASAVEVKKTIGLAGGNSKFYQFTDARLGSDVGNMQMTTRGFRVFQFSEFQQAKSFGFYNRGTIEIGRGDIVIDGLFTELEITRYTIDGGIWFGDPLYGILGLGIQGISMSRDGKVNTPEWGDAFSTILVRAGVGIKFLKRFRIEVDIERARSPRYISESQNAVFIFDY
jgi:hypothetical protein